MWKKLIVFSMAFCLSLFLLQFRQNEPKTDSVQYEVKTDSVEALSNQTISQNSSNARSALQISLENRALFKNLIAEFQKAVAVNDRKKIVSLLSFPVDVFIIGKKNKQSYKVIKSEKEFLKNYENIFDDSLKQCISRIDPNKLLFSTSGEVFVFPATAGLRMKLIQKNDGASFEAKIINISSCKYNNDAN